MENLDQATTCFLEHWEGGSDVKLLLVWSAAKYFNVLVKSNLIIHDVTFIDNTDLICF